MDLTEPGQDQFGEGVWAHSVSALYQWNDSASLSLGVSKLNRPENYAYQGSLDRPLGNREGTLYASLSLRLRFQPPKAVKAGSNQP